MSVKQDLFLNIAGAGGSISRQDLLAENTPHEKSAPLLTTVAGSASAFVPAEVFGERELAAELATLRKWAEPFLAAYNLTGEATRESIRITEFDWCLVPPHDERLFHEALGGKARFSRVSVPHYGPPTGRALSWYRGSFQVTDAFLENRSVWLRFEGADYHARVYVNGRCVGEHEGFFSPFEFDVTSCVQAGENILFVELRNDGVCMGFEGQPDGDKLYAATGPGWDEPEAGWHHCPPGMGLYRPVSIETRPKIFIRDAWVRPLYESAEAEVHFEVFNTDFSTCRIDSEIEIQGSNFQEPGIARVSPELPEAGPGATFYKARIPIPNFRNWSLDAPWLYQADVRISRGGQVLDRYSSRFGMRSFVIDEASEPKGKIFLNGSPIRLRGANTMGFEQQRVASGDREGLIHDLLMARACNMNFLRFTQRPVEKEVYDLCDSLGILAQTDLPLFGFLRRTQFCEAVRQSAEMARHTRRHPSNVLLTFINEPFSIEWSDRTHRHLRRDELEGFFLAATQAIRVEDPDIQIKPADGDYDPPAGLGLPDTHIYSLWYNGHGLSFGELYAGNYPRTKKGWNYGCGEYGAEGLDYADLMLRRYPPHWLPPSGARQDSWNPKNIFRSQTGALYYLHFDRQDCLEDWVRASQEYQAWAVGMMTESFRRDDRLVSCAVHLFIDAWPAGWMKSIVDCERRPKPAFFALRKAFSPIHLSLRSDRFFAWSTEEMETELWIANDRPYPLTDSKVVWQLEKDGQVLASGSNDAVIPACSPVLLGRVQWTAPLVQGRAKVTLRAALFVSGERKAENGICIPVFESAPSFRPEIRVTDAENSQAALLARDAFPDSSSEGEITPLDRTILTSSWPDSPEEQERIMRWVEGGGHFVLYHAPLGNHLIGGEVVTIKKCGFWPANFVSRKTGHPLIEGFEADDFRCWFHSEHGRIKTMLSSVILAPDSWDVVLRTGDCGWGVESQPAAACVRKRFGNGYFTLCQLDLVARAQHNPPAAIFLRRLFQTPAPSQNTSGFEKGAFREPAFGLSAK